MTTTASLPLVPAGHVRTLPMAVPTWRYIGFLIGPGAGSFAFNAVTVTMPQLREAFTASEVQLELVVAGYGIPFAVLLILGGRLGDRFGRHLLYALGMALFLLSAVACAASPTIEVLIAARVLQGVGASLCTPQVLATIQATSAGGARVRAIAAFGASGGIGAAGGQVLGGALAGATLAGLAGWRAIYVVVAIAALAAIALAPLAPRSRVHEAVTIDVAGTVELGAGVLLIASALTFGPSAGWSWPTFVALAAGAAALVALWVHQDRIERSGRVPLLPPSILRLRALQLGLVAAALFFTGYGAVLYVIPRAVEAGLGYDSLTAGLLLLPFAVVFAVVSLSLTPIQRRLGVRTLVWGVVLQLIALVGFLLVSLVAWGPSLIWWAQPALVLLGAGQALVFSPLTQAVVREVPVEAAGLSGGMFSTVQQLALSIGVIAIGAVTTATGWRGRDEVVAGFVLDVALACGVLALALVLTAALRRGAHR